MPLGKALTEGGGKAASFEDLGDETSGVVISAEMRQATDLETGKPGFWDNGDPKMNAIITVQTDQRDPSIDGDDGARSVYVKWWGPNKLTLQQVIRAATSHLPEEQQDIIKGGWFGARLVDKLPSQTKGFSPSKVFSYAYRPPASGLGKALANGSGNTAPPTAQAQHPAPAYQPPAAPPAAVQQQPQLPVQQADSGWPAAQPAPATNAVSPGPQQGYVSTPSDQSQAASTYDQTTAPAAPPYNQPPPPPMSSNVPPAADPMEVIARIKTLAAPPVSMTPVQISQLVPQYSAEAIAAIVGV